MDGRVERERKRDRWRHHLQAWCESGLSQAEYCRRHSLSTKVFTYWKRTLKEEATPLSFVPVPVKSLLSPRLTDRSSLVVVGSRFKVEVGDGFNPATFERLMRVLEQI